MPTKEKETVENSPEIAEATAGDIKVIEDQLPETSDKTETKSVGENTRMYLLSALAKDAAGALDELTALISTAGSKVEKAEDLGLKKLAFPINKHLELSLVSVFFNADTQTIKVLEAELKHADTVERHLLSTWRAGLEEPKRRLAERQKREVRVDV
ncbi:MAG: 30S ribosomal protein S6 [bacterium]|nr:30S ribosomal protein S6 [bacterium]